MKKGELLFRIASCLALGIAASVMITVTPAIGVVNYIACVYMAWTAVEGVMEDRKDA